MSINVGLGGVERCDSLRGELLVLNAQAVFCRFLFFVEIEKKL